MFLRHGPSSLCNTTGTPLGVALSAALSSALRKMPSGRHAILDITNTKAPNLAGCEKVDLLSNFALLYSGASRQPA